ncbi:MAG: ABC transporter permease [Rikenellaceae bacterium]|nr:ABC transporter permease [Rikenellaceae bacterium]
MINLISGISAFTVAIPVLAMVVLLSVFNGFETLIRSMYRHFDPPIEITARHSKVFGWDSIDAEAIRSLPEVTAISRTLEENALFEYRERQVIGMLKGVDSLFSTVVPIEDMVVSGQYELKFGDLDQALVGQGVAFMLDIRTAYLESLQVYMPRRGKTVSYLPLDMYRRKAIYPAGVFALDGETDSQYVLVPLDFARSILDYDSTRVSALAVGLREGADPNRVRARIAEITGEGFDVKTRFQQKAELYRLMQYEKWGIYLMILLVLVIASFSVVGSLIMIIVDKKKDTDTLITLGADTGLVRRIFIREGLLISGIGTGIGLILGVLISLGQQQFGWVKLAGQSFLINAYPVELRGTDLLGIVLSVGLINYLITRFTVGRMVSSRELYKAK